MAVAHSGAGAGEARWQANSKLLYLLWGDVLRCTDVGWSEDTRFTKPPAPIQGANRPPSPKSSDIRISNFLN